MAHLREALHTLVGEQQELYQKAAHSTLSLGRLHQRLVLMERYFLAMVRKGVVPPEVETEEAEREGAHGGTAGEETEEVEHGAAEEREGGGVVKVELPESVKKKQREDSVSMEKSGSERNISSGCVGVLYTAGLGISHGLGPLHLFCVYAAARLKPPAVWPRLALLAWEPGPPSPLPLPFSEGHGAQAKTVTFALRCLERP